MERSGSPVTVASDFEYTAIDDSGARRRGIVSAADAHAAQDALRRQGLVATELQARSDSLFDQLRRPSIQDHAVGLRALADALQSGMPVAKALELLGDLAPPSWSPALPLLRESVRLGQPLSSALSTPSLGLPPLVISLAAAGEATGSMAGALRRSADYCENQARFAADLRQALAYPAILAVSSGITIVLMLAVVLPRFAGILADLGQELPTSTRALLWVGSMGRLLALISTLVFASVLVYGLTLRRRTDGQRKLAAVMLASHGIGRLRMMYRSARLADTLALMLESGVPIRRALALAAGATGDAEIIHRTVQAEDSLRAGVALSSALEAGRVVTDLVVRLVRSGEVSGDLPGALRQAARLEEERAERWLRSLARTLEPTLILVFALLVGTVAVAILQAVYALRPI